MADRGLLSLDNLDQIEAVAESLSRSIDFILAVPARRYGELGDRIRFVDVAYGPAEIAFQARENSPTYRLIVDYDQQAAARQRETRQAKLDELLILGQKLEDKLDR